MASKITLKNLEQQEFTIQHPDGVGAGTIKSTDITYKIDSVDDFASVPSAFDTVIVKDKDRGGVFNKITSTTANGGTIFDGNGCSWERQYSGAVNVKWFGAKDTNEVGYENYDSTSAIQNAIKSLNDFKLINATKTEALEPRNYSGGGEVYIPTGVFKVSSTILVPSFITIRGEDKGMSQIRQTNGSIEATISSLLYKQTDGLYNASYDTEYLPTGSELDGDNYITSTKIYISNISIQSNAQNKVGMFLVGASNSFFSNIDIGFGQGQSFKVGLVACGAWATNFERITAMAYSQGFVFANSNSASSCVGLWALFNGNLGENYNSTREYIFDDLEDISTVGSTGITVHNTNISFFSPAVEGHYYCFKASNSYTNVYSPHFESAGRPIRYTFILENVNGNIEATNVSNTLHTSDGAGILLADFAIVGQEHGLNIESIRYMTTLPLFKQIGSFENVITLPKVGLHFLRNGKLGLVSDKIFYDTSWVSSYSIYLDGTNGDDENFGLAAEGAVKTLNRALELIDIYRLSNVVLNIVEDITLSDNTVYNLPSGITLNGYNKTITLPTNSYFTLDGDITINCIIDASARSSYIFLQANNNISSTIYVKNKVMGDSINTTLTSTTSSSNRSIFTIKGHGYYFDTSTLINLAKSWLPSSMPLNIEVTAPTDKKPATLYTGSGIAIGYEINQD